MRTQDKPVVFACAGCSFAGRLAYDLALELDRRGIAEMSCLAGLAAQKKPFLRKVEGRSVWIVDGCPIECSLGVYEGLQRRADVHIRLHDFDIKKYAAPEAGVSMDGLVGRVLDQVDLENRILQESASSSNQLDACGPRPHRQKLRAGH